VVVAEIAAVAVAATVVVEVAAVIVAVIVVVVTVAVAVVVGAVAVAVAAEVVVVAVVAATVVAVAAMFINVPNFFSPCLYSLACSAGSSSEVTSAVTDIKDGGRRTWLENWPNAKLLLTKGKVSTEQRQTTCIPRVGF
jgi:hypothetical protein